MNSSSPETIYVNNVSVSCNGDGGTLGHPRVYLKMDERGSVDCGYCDRHFILTGGVADHRQVAKTA